MDYELIAKILGFIGTIGVAWRYLDGKFSDINKEFTAVRQEMNSDFKAVRKEISTLDTSIQAEFTSIRTDNRSLDSRIARIEGVLSSTEQTLREFLKNRQFEQGYSQAKQEIALKNKKRK